MTASNTPLALGDILDVRAYERERERFRAEIIELKKIRRVPVGAVVSLVFENRETVWFQIQEMARAEKLFSDEAIRTELETYNPLIPPRGSLSATLFIEVTSRTEMHDWLTKLVGVEECVHFEAGGHVIPCEVDEAHAANLTRDAVTAAVHFVNFRFQDEQLQAFRQGPVALAVHHPAYSERAVLSDATRSSLLEDLLG